MTRIVPVFDYQKEIISFVEHGLWNGQCRFSDARALGFANATDGLVAGFIYHNYDPLSRVIEMSAYSTCRDWNTPERLRLIFNYPFAVAGVRLLVARHSEKNTRCRRMWKTFGASETLIPELHGPGEAEVVAVLKRGTWENSKLIGPDHG